MFAYLIVAFVVLVAALLVLAACVRSSQMSREEEARPMRRMGYVGTQSRWSEANEWGPNKE